MRSTISTGIWTALPWDYGIELIQEDIDRISDELEMAFARYPVLTEVGVKNWVNGAFTFSPDGNPLRARCLPYRTIGWHAESWLGFYRAVAWEKHSPNG